MESMLSFVTKSIRKNNFSVSEFIDSLPGISRAKFYRYMKEPENFSDETLNAIVEKLNFSDEEKAQLFSFRGVKPTTPYKEKYIEAFVFPKSIFEYGDTTPNFTYFDSGEQEFQDEFADESESFSINSYTVRGLANKMIGSIKEETEKELLRKNLDANSRFYHNMNVMIFNCTSKTKNKILAKLFYTLQNSMFRDPSQNNNIHIKVSQIFDKKPDTIDEQSQFWLRAMPLISSHDDYSYYFDNDGNYGSRFLCRGKGDCCIIKHSCLAIGENQTYTSARNMPINKRAHVYKYYFINMKADAQNYIMPIDKYQYMLYTIDTMKNIDKKTDLPSINSFNEKLLEYNKNSKKILLKYDFCFDNIDNKMWRNAVMSAINTKPIEELEKLRGIFGKELDSHAKIMNNLSEEQVRGIMSEAILTSLGIINERYKIGNEKRNINIIYKQGIIDFVENGMMRDANLESLKVQDLVKFKSEDVRSFIKKIKSNITNRKNNIVKDEQQYYIIDMDFDEIPYIEKNTYMNYTLALFESKAMFVCNSVNGDYGNYRERKLIKNDHSDSSSDFEFIGAVYSYIIDDLIENRNEIGQSIIMTDKESIEFLDKVINLIPESYQL